MPVVEAAGLRKRLGRRWVLDGVDLAVEEGTCTVVRGPNGSGKTTLLRVLAGAMPPDGGTLRVAGVDAAQEPDRVRGAVGSYFGEDRSWYWRLSGRQNLEFFAVLHPASKFGMTPGDLLDLVGLSDAAGRRVGEYSTGMRARLGLARALLANAPVILLDEPTRSLDPEAASDFHRVVLDRLLGERTLVVATHDPAEEATLASDVVTLRAGRLTTPAPRSGT